MNFDASVMLMAAEVLTAIGVLVGGYALFAEYRERSALLEALNELTIQEESERLRDKDRERERLRDERLLGRLRTTTTAKTLSTSTVQITELDASRAH